MLGFLFFIATSLACRNDDALDPYTILYSPLYLVDSDSARLYSRYLFPHPYPFRLDFRSSRRASRVRLQEESRTGPRKPCSSDDRVLRDSTCPQTDACPRQRPLVFAPAPETFVFPPVRGWSLDKCRLSSIDRRRTNIRPGLKWMDAAGERRLIHKSGSTTFGSAAR